MVLTFRVPSTSVVEAEIRPKTGAVGHDVSDMGLLVGRVEEVGHRAPCEDGHVVAAMSFRLFRGGRRLHEVIARHLGVRQFGQVASANVAVYDDVMLVETLTVRVR